jgi:hypothetical protein
VTHARPNRAALLAIVPALIGLLSATDTKAQPSAGTGADAYGYLQQYVAHGLHRSGTPGDRRVAAWMSSQLRRFGYSVATEDVSFQRFEPLSSRLHFTSDPVSNDVKVFPYYYSGSTPFGGVTAQLIDVGSDTALEIFSHDVKGKIVLASVAEQTPGVMPSLANLLQNAKQHGALGVVAAVQGPANYIATPNVTPGPMLGMPTLFVGKQDGDALKTRNGQRVHFELYARLSAGTTENVIATLDGLSDQIITVGTPINGWFTAGTERGSGVGTFLTIARDLADRYRRRKPPKTIRFIATGGHELGGVGLSSYVSAHPDVIQKTYAYVHLGAALGGFRYIENADGSITDTGLVDPSRTFYISSVYLQALTSAAAAVNGMFPYLALPPRLADPGEQQYMYAAGVPMVSMSGTTLYFHTEGDTADTTSAEILDPVVRTFSSVVDQLIASCPEFIRAVP